MHYDTFADPRLALPARALAIVNRRLGDTLLVGSWARDVCLTLGADLPLGRATDDVDIAVATATLADLDARLGDLAPRRGHGVRIVCDGIAVDVIPFGDVARDGIVEPSTDSSLDVTGMAEAHTHADTLALPGGTVLRTASLPWMIALKVIAWDVRSPGTDKDAEDLDRLLQATCAGPHLDACYAEAQAARWDFDVELIGPWRAGRTIGSQAHPATLDRLGLVLATERVDRLLAGLPGRGADRRAQLAAFVAGYSDA